MWLPPNQASLPLLGKGHNAQSLRSKQYVVDAPRDHIPQNTFYTRAFADSTTYVRPGTPDPALLAPLQHA